METYQQRVIAFFFFPDVELPAALFGNDCNKVDKGDNEIYVEIMGENIAMPEEHRAMLRKMMLIGVTRLVVERGTIIASVLFNMEATEQIKRADKAMTRDSQSVTYQLGSGRMRTNSKNSLSVSSPSFWHVTCHMGKVCAFSFHHNFNY